MYQKKPMDPEVREALEKFIKNPIAAGVKWTDCTPKWQKGAVPYAFKTQIGELEIMINGHHMETPNEFVFSCHQLAILQKKLFTKDPV